ncbi:MAG: AAA family ATPase [Bacteroidetes bacterium]|nr:AAA family ATPase [Bacteroidota bacterium]
MKKIVIIGPESTGKSTLGAMLSEHYRTIWCPEYARTYLTEKGTNYEYEDLLHIAKGQVALEEEYLHRLSNQSSSDLLFIDTDMYVMKVWSVFVFQQCHQYILDQIAIRKYDAYLLCKPDIQWEQDGLREYPDPLIRQSLYHYYKDLLMHQHLPWIEIEGAYEERLRKAIAFVDSFCY